eukprot:7390999-Prymnesium_polylepis.2
MVLTPEPPSPPPNALPPPVSSPPPTAAVVSSAELRSAGNSAVAMKTSTPTGASDFGAVTALLVAGVVLMVASAGMKTLRTIMQP